MKRSELWFNIISVFVDALMLFLAGVASFYTRVHFVGVVGPVIYNLKFDDYLILVAKIIPVLLLIFAVLGLYKLRGTRRFSSELGRILIGVSLGLLMVVVLFFFNQSLFPSRFIILAAWGLSVVLVVFGRLILRSIQEQLFRIGRGLHNVALINGTGAEAEFIRNTLKNLSLGYRIVAEFNYNPDLIPQLEELYRQKAIDEIIQTDSKVADQLNYQLVEFARNKGLQFSYVPNVFEVQHNAIELTAFEGVPLISLKNTPLDGWGRVAKRLFDIVTSAACLLITLPLFFFLAVAIKIDSPGKIFYGASRGGRRKDFRFYKFRSMYSHLSVGDEYGGKEAEKMRRQLWEKNDRGGASGPFLKVKDDPRVTRMGKFMRKTKLDELPQFWNVIWGDMSMVGPRAHVLDEVERYRNRYRRMFSIKPGIFGLSQIAQITWPDLPFEEEIRLNTYYIENWSLWLDMKILAKCFYFIFFAKKPKENY